MIISAKSLILTIAMLYSWKNELIDINLSSEYIDK